MSQVQGVDSEVGQLKTVLMHRPGVEVERITPRHSDRLLFGSLPWVSKARQEHDVLSQVLRDQGVQVLDQGCHDLSHAGIGDLRIRPDGAFGDGFCGVESWHADLYLYFPSTGA